MGEDSHCQEGVRASLPPVIDHQTWHPPTQSIRLPFLAALSSLLQTPSTHHREPSAINEEDDLRNSNSTPWNSWQTGSCC